MQTHVHMYVQSLTLTTIMMFQIQIFARRKDGKKGDLLTTSKYPTEEQAWAAYQRLLLLRTWKTTPLHGKNEYGTYKFKGAIISEPKPISVN